MSIDIYVQDMNHRELECIIAPGEFTLASIASDAPVGSLLNSIDKYSKTMFNSYQLKFMLMELEGATPKDDQEREMISKLQTASESAIRQQGYLWFTGD